VGAADTLGSPGAVLFFCYVYGVGVRAVKLNYSGQKYIGGFCLNSSEVFAGDVIDFVDFHFQNSFQWATVCRP
jgi:hypothetical protein